MKSDLKNHNGNVISSTFSSFCQESSRYRLAHLTRVNQNEVTLTKTSDVSSYGDWMVVVFAHSSSFRLSVKIHYCDPAAQILANLSRGTKDQLLGVTAINDFMREYSNQLIGSVKRSFEEQSAIAKTSCPLVTRGQDAMFFAPNPASAAFEDCWWLKLADVEIKCSICLEFIDNTFMKKVFLPAFFDFESIGDVEFFE